MDIIITRPSTDWKAWYLALRERDYDVYMKALVYAEASRLNLGLSVKEGAEVERTIVMFACELLEVKPKDHL